MFFKNINDHDKAKNENEFDTVVDGSHITECRNKYINPFED